MRRSTNGSKVFNIYREVMNLRLSRAQGTLQVLCTEDWPEELLDHPTQATETTLSLLKHMIGRISKLPKAKERAVQIRVTSISNGSKQGPGEENRAARFC